MRQIDKDIYYNSVAIRPTHQENLKHLEELEVKYAELKQGVSHGTPNKRPRT